jgi:hypothetical protein
LRPNAKGDIEMINKKEIMKSLREEIYNIHTMMIKSRYIDDEQIIPPPTKYISKYNNWNRDVLINKDENLGYLYLQNFKNTNFNSYMKLTDTLIFNIKAYLNDFNKDIESFIGYILQILSEETKECKILMNIASKKQLVEHYRCLNRVYLNLIGEFNKYESIIDEINSKRLDRDMDILSGEYKNK